MKYLEVKWTKYEQESYIEIYQTLSDIIDGIKWTDVPCLRIGWFNIVMISVHSKLIYILSTSPIQFPAGFAPPSPPPEYKKLVLNLM